jgi:hypothetical protein
MAQLTPIIVDIDTDSRIGYWRITLRIDGQLYHSAARYPTASLYSDVQHKIDQLAERGAWVTAGPIIRQRMDRERLPADGRGC